MAAPKQELPGKNRESQSDVITERADVTRATEAKLRALALQVDTRSDNPYRAA